MYHRSQGLLKERQGYQQKRFGRKRRGDWEKEMRKTIGQASQPERWMAKLRTTEIRSTTLRFGGGARARIRRRQIARQPRGVRRKGKGGDIRRLLLDAAGSAAAADGAVSPRPEAGGAPQSKLLTRDACWQPRDIVRGDQVFALGASLARDRLPGWRRMDGQPRLPAFICLATMASSSATGRPVMKAEGLADAIHYER
ncbi:predicted protein [Verticillium alfalfae VaMs.102]|uniref:Predicted protein n=1 Tax=Verticillium alfalfae (strain VaMs.102 / ATCC MYA-4576 / FGSC 10136) TaxID=526221 RepID=C9SMD6_VERA1|nr:predicted protein [Verticillium alfalfae VaMs.102]EEY19951.1 predicted protein [Verticillium alfalfae VaMs.102]